MTVKELIEHLEKVEDKNVEVVSNNHSKTKDGKNYYKNTAEIIEVLRGNGKIIIDTDIVTLLER